MSILGNIVDSVTNALSSVTELLDITIDRGDDGSLFVGVGHDATPEDAADGYSHCTTTYRIGGPEFISSTLTCSYAPYDIMFEKINSIPHSIDEIGWMDLETTMINRGALKNIQGLIDASAMLTSEEKGQLTALISDYQAMYRTQQEYLFAWEDAADAVQRDFAQAGEI